MAKKSRKPQPGNDLRSQFEEIVRMGTMAVPAGALTPGVGFPSQIHPAIITRTYTTYSAYEEPIGTE